MMAPSSCSAAGAAADQAIAPQGSRFALLHAKHLRKIGKTLGECRVSGFDAGCSVA